MFPMGTRWTGCAASAFFAVQALLFFLLDGCLVPHPLDVPLGGALDPGLFTIDGRGRGAPGVSRLPQYLATLSMFGWLP